MTAHFELPLNTRYVNEEKANWYFMPDIDNGWTVYVHALDGEPLAQVTKYIETRQADYNQIMVKAYSENEGMLECLRANNIIDREETPVRIKAGFAHMFLCNLSADMLAKLREQEPEYFARVEEHKSGKE